MNYRDLFQKSIRHPVKFWKEQADAIEWLRKPRKVLRKNEEGYNIWYPDGELNMSYLCIDKHIKEGHGRQTAIIYDSPVSKQKDYITYHELYHEVAHLAGGLKRLGLRKGDRVLIYMPMIPQAIYAMLACARIGVIHSIVFGGFAPHELAVRIDDCKPKVILTASNGIEVNKVIPYKPIVDEAIREATYKPKFVVVYDRKLGVKINYGENDIDYDKLIRYSEAVNPVKLNSTHPLYILYTSGTTGPPKGVVRDTGGYAAALRFTMQYIFGANEGDVFWAASDIGWVVGHSYIVYGPLLNREYYCSFRRENPLKHRMHHHFGVSFMNTK